MEEERLTHGQFKDQNGITVGGQASGKRQGETYRPNHERETEAETERDVKVFVMPASKSI